MIENFIDPPLQTVMRPGAILGSVAHAVFVARCPDLAHEQSWDGQNYSVHDSAGSRATVAFSQDRFVGVCFYEQSERNPFRHGSPYSISQFVSGVPASLQGLLANEALQYMLQEIDRTVSPVVTAAFWCDADSPNISASEPWSDVTRHGACLLHRQFMNPQEAIAQWAIEYALGASELQLVRSLFELKMTDPRPEIHLGESDRALLANIAKSRAGFEASAESFSEIGIMFRDK